MNNKFIQQIKCWFTFLFMICSTFSAWGAYAQTAKVTLQMDNVRMEQVMNEIEKQTSYFFIVNKGCLLYTSPSPRDGRLSRMPSSA